MMLRVMVSGREVSEREVICRVSATDIAERREARVGLRPRSDEDLAADIARDRVAVRVWGRGCRWRHSGQGVAHRGQVWAPCKTGGEDARTGVITMRVEAA